jgi:CBS domain containing-hemolysin-like protein
LIEKRLEDMASRQEEFLEKLETIVRGNWLKFLVMYSAEEFPRFHVKKDLDMSQPSKSLKVWREQNSILIAFRGEKATVIAEKSDKNLVIVSDGFKLTERRKTSINIAFCIFLLLPIITVIFGALYPYKTAPPEWDKVILVFLALQGLMIWLVMFLRKTVRKATKIHTRILKSCVEETINLLK